MRPLPVVAAAANITGTGSNRSDMTQTNPASDDGNETGTAEDEFELHDDMDFRVGAVTIDDPSDDPAMPISSTFNLIVANDGSVTIETVQSDVIVGRFDVTQLEREAREQVKEHIDPEVREAHMDNPDFPFPDTSNI